MSAHEEFEVGRELDQAVRTAITVIAQAMERASRTSAERDRQAAHQLRQQILHGQTPAPRETGTALPRTAEQMRAVVGDSPRYREYGPVLFPDPGVEPTDLQRVDAWTAAMRDVARDPESQAARFAAGQLAHELKQRQGVDLAGRLADAVSDLDANQAQDRREHDHARSASREQQAATENLTEGVDLGKPTTRPAEASSPRELVEVVVPAGNQNPDRGIAPTKAKSPAEAEHRRQAWERAKDAFHGQYRPTTRSKDPYDLVGEANAAWAKLPKSDQYERFWAAYDTERARTVRVDAADAPPRQDTPGQHAPVAARESWSAATTAQPMEGVFRAGDTDIPVLVTGPATQSDQDGRWYVPTQGGAHVPAEQLIGADAEALGYQPAWAATAGDVDRGLFDQAVQAAHGPGEQQPVPAATVLIPAGRDNPDRGMSPSKAATPEETQHRRNAWRAAEQEFTQGQSTPAAEVDAAWKDQPFEEKSARFWAAYDTEAARTVPSTDPAAFTAGLRAPAAEPPVLTGAEERGFAPTKAPTPAERAHRELAWQVARDEFTSALPADTAAAAATKQWDNLDWQDKALRYWTAYDSPATHRVDGQPAADRAVPANASAPQDQGVSRQRVVELNGQAADWFAGQATPGSKGHDYLQDRLGSQVLQEGHWSLGYAPPGWTNLTAHLRSEGANDQEILAAGLGRTSSRGNVIDAFRDRAMVGVRDAEGDVVGFVGRDLSGDDRAPKYVNTGGTPAYTKGNHLLGLHEAPDGARLARVEGPFDAIAVTAAGQGQVAGVAPLGTALTGTQADQLAQHSDGRVWLALDSDAAGRAAAEADYWLLADRKVHTSLIDLPEGQDPAQVWQRDPDLLRSQLAVADDAPDAGVVVIDRGVDELRQGLLDGEAEAHEELAALEDQVLQNAPTNEAREQIRAHTTEAVDQLHEPEPTPAEVNEARTYLRGILDEQQPEEDQAVAADRPSARVVKEEPVKKSEPSYDRTTESNLTIVSDDEAHRARVTSSYGYTRSTRDMLSEAEHRRGTPAKKDSSQGASVARTRTQRR